MGRKLSPSEVSPHHVQPSSSLVPAVPPRPSPKIDSASSVVVLSHVAHGRRRPPRLVSRIGDAAGGNSVERRGVGGGEGDPGEVGLRDRGEGGGVGGRV